MKEEFFLSFSPFSSSDLCVNSRCAKAINDKIHEILLAQQKSKTAPVQMQAVSSADELLKYKNLLDMGAITQEEFEQKKKQLLGL